MNNTNLVVDLEPHLDGEQNVFYVGRLRAPIYLDLANGVTFLVFISEDGDEELQIAVNDREDTTFSRVSKKRDRLKIKLKKSTDRFGSKFYVAKLQMSGYIKCHDEISFVVFISKEGKEELQISGGISDSFDKPTKHTIEVLRKR